jgi:hypothetical protein
VGVGPDSSWANSTKLGAIANPTFPAADSGRPGVIVVLTDSRRGLPISSPSLARIVTDGAISLRFTCAELRCPEAGNP